MTDNNALHYEAVLAAFRAYRSCARPTAARSCCKAVVHERTTYIRLKPDGPAWSLVGEHLRRVPTATSRRVTTVWIKHAWGLCKLGLITREQRDGFEAVIRERIEAQSRKDNLAYLRADARRIGCTVIDPQEEDAS